MRSFAEIERAGETTVAYDLKGIIYLWRNGASRIDGGAGPHGDSA